MTPFLAATGGARRRHLLFASMAGLVLLAVSLAAFELVVMKMLPFDNQSELQVVVDLPEGRTLEDTGALRSEEHTSELQSLMRISYAVFCLKKKNIRNPDSSQNQSSQL